MQAESTSATAAAPRTSPAWRTVVVLACWAALLAVMLVLANRLWFLCDDAFITFRHVANAHDGFGLVYNAPPFAPVEGTTGFSWALLLWAAWSVLGCEPPDAANVLSMACGVLQFAVVAVAACGLRRRDGGRVAPAVAFLTVAAIVTNRTFVQWLTSGLETSLFNLAFVAWVLHAFRRVEGPRTQWLFVWTLLAAVAAATRPDGLLLVAVTLAAALVARREWAVSWRQLAIGVAPGALVVAHALFRRLTYGEWLPNTYYAKVVGAWPEAGWRYLLCFAAEHGTWLCAAIAVAWAVRAIRRRLSSPRLAAIAPVAAVAAVLAHAAYYVVVVGGDHFEYRVLSQCVPLCALATAAMAARLSDRTIWHACAVVCLWLASSVGWLHYAVTRDLPANGFHPITPKVPAVLRPLAAWYDRHQCWLHLHYVCLRCNQHANALDGFRGELPARARQQAAGDDIPVHLATTAGYCAWVMPDVAIIDRLGLNDWVIARCPRVWTDQFATALRSVFAAIDADADGWLSPAELRLAAAAGSATGFGAAPAFDHLWVLGGGERPGSLSRADWDAFVDSFVQRGHMAHERLPPPGYVEAFAPNATATRDGVRIAPRPEPLTRARVQAIEAAWRAWIRRGAPADGRPDLGR